MTSAQKSPSTAISSYTGACMCTPLIFFFINSSDDQVMGGDAKPSSTSESLGNDESDGNENGKKSNGFRSTK